MARCDDSDINYYLNSLDIINMPPKRKRPSTTGPTSASKPAAPRRSKLAKENNITADQESEIREAFNLFSVDSDDASGQVIATADIRRCLIALNAPPASGDELREISEALDSDESGYVSFEHFIAIAALKIQSKTEDEEDVREEVVNAYRLFTKGQERAIQLADLRRVAKELREDVPEDVLKDMIREATGGGLSGVGMDEFEGVMRRAGVFG